MQSISGFVSTKEWLTLMFDGRSSRAGAFDILCYFSAGRVRCVVVVGQ